MPPSLLDPPSFASPLFSFLYTTAISPSPHIFFILASASFLFSSLFCSLHSVQLSTPPLFSLYFCTFSASISFHLFSRIFSVIGYALLRCMIHLYILCWWKRPGHIHLSWILMNVCLCRWNYNILDIRRFQLSWYCTRTHRQIIRDMIFFLSSSWKRKNKAASTKEKRKQAIMLLIIC